MKTLDVIKSLKNLKIRYEDDDKVVFTGSTNFVDIQKNDKDVEVTLHLSVAPSVQSMLSRGGNIGCSVWIKVDGITAIYHSDTAPDEMTEIGGFLHDVESQITKQQEQIAYEDLELHVSKNS